MSNATAKSSALRLEHYRRVNGTRRITPRQLRRINHKQNHAMAPFGKKAGS